MDTIAITMGEPGGIGPEIIVKALYRPEIRKCCNPVVVGDARVLQQALKLTGIPMKIKPISSLSDSMQVSGIIEVIDIPSSKPFERGVPSKNSGRAEVAYVKKAVEFALKRKVRAIVTTPISKKSLALAGYTWPGHTELLAQLTEARDYAMMFVSKKLKLILCTIHVALQEVPKIINKQRVYKTILLAQKGMAMLGLKNPRVAVAGLNPHAGESGLFGREEITSITPAVQRALKEGMRVSGPHAPDTVFYRASAGEFDIVLCMYHDQGLIPFKMLAFDTGVNVTVGLPIIRTSPDHGTAFDIAWKNVANPSSMVEAIKLASKLRL